MVHAEDRDRREDLEVAGEASRMDGHLAPCRREHQCGDGPPPPRTGISEQGSFRGEGFLPLLLDVLP